MTRTATAAALVLALAGASPGEAPAHHARAVRPEDLAYVYGVGRFVPEYAPPAPGTYRLPPIDDVADHPLLGSDGQRTTLYTLTGDRIAIVAFVYTSCAEATGCPVSMGVLHHLDREIAADATLARRVRLVTISFDPERDTPGSASPGSAPCTSRGPTGHSPRPATRPSLRRSWTTSASRWRGCASRTARGPASTATC